MNIVNVYSKYFQPHDLHTEVTLYFFSSIFKTNKKICFSKDTLHRVQKNMR